MADKISWHHFEKENAQVWDGEYWRDGWDGLNPREAWPARAEELRVNPVGYSLHRTDNPPPPNPPISVVFIFNDHDLAHVADSAAKRLNLHFGCFHLDVHEYIVSIARTLESDGGMSAYNERRLGWLHPEGLGNLVNQGRVLEMSPRHMVEIVKWKIDQLVAEGKRRFVITNYPSTPESMGRFVGVFGTNGISFPKSVVLFWSYDTPQEQARIDTMQYFSAIASNIQLQRGQGADEAYAILMWCYMERAQIRMTQLEGEKSARTADAQAVKQVDSEDLGMEVDESGSDEEMVDSVVDVKE